MKKKINYKKICLLLVVLIVSCVAINGVEAAITTDNSGGTGTEATLAQTGIAALANVIAKFGEYGFSGVVATVTSLIALTSVIMFMALETFLIVGGVSTGVAMPDTIVFNKFAFFDPNFINPHELSFVYQIQGILGNLFESFRVVAIAIFIIAAMVMGIKMAISSVASKKAQYKEAALKWITGFLILICLKWLLAGIFLINEKIVSMLYSIIASKDMSIPIYITDTFRGWFGKALKDVIRLVTNGTPAFWLSGYVGIVANNIAKAFGGDVVASIVGFVIMGQTLTIVGSYLKRLFMCIILGIISPLIVAADTIMSSMGKQSTIFKSWFQNFSLTVFMQILHAMYMVVTIQILSKLYVYNSSTGELLSSATNQMQASIATIVLTTGLVKLEKMFKSLFGIGDSFAGDLKSGAKGMVQAMGAVRGIAAGAKAVGDNAGKMRDAAKRKQAYSKELSNLKSQPSREKASVAFEAAKKAKEEGNMDEYYRQRKIAADAMKDAKGAGYQFDPKSGFGPGVGQSSEGGNNNNSSKGSGDYLEGVLKGSSNLTREEKIQRLEQGIADAQSDYKSARLAHIMGPANLAAGIGIGIGMGDDLGEALFKGGHITAALDKGAEYVGHRVADKDRKTFASYEREQGEKYDYKPSEKIIREKTEIEQVVTNPKLYVNPAAIEKEIIKQFKGIGEVFSDTMKKELRRADKNLDDSQ